jgi:hypothetical protein
MYEAAASTIVVDDRSDRSMMGSHVFIAVVSCVDAAAAPNRLVQTALSCAAVVGFSSTTVLDGQATDSAVRETRPKARCSLRIEGVGGYTLLTLVADRRIHHLRLVAIFEVPASDPRQQWRRSDEHRCGGALFDGFPIVGPVDLFPLGSRLVPLQFGPDAPGITALACPLGPTAELRPLQKAHWPSWIVCTPAKDRKAFDRTADRRKRQG